MWTPGLPNPVQTTIFFGISWGKKKENFAVVASAFAVVIGCYYRFSRSNVRIAISNVTLSNHNATLGIQM